MTSPTTANARPGDAPELIRLLTDALPQMVWSTGPDGVPDYFNAQWYAFTGFDAQTMASAGWVASLHADDQQRALAAWQESVRTGEAYDIEYRLHHFSGDYRWVLCRGLPVAGRSGAVMRWVGTCTDIDSSKRAAEQNVLLSAELEHRIKNLFAVITSLLTQATVATPALAAPVADLTAQIAALARAHDYARPQPQASPPTLQAMLGELLRPYPAFLSGDVQILGDDPAVGVNAATSLALAVHELATNAVKYGALSGAGQLEIRVAEIGPAVRIDWIEQGTAAMPRAAVTGFGGRLLVQTVERQLQGTLHRAWTAGGLHVTIEVPAARLR